MKIPIFLLEEKQYKPFVKINIDKNSTIKETVNNYFENKYQILDFFINSNESLSFFQNEKYDKFDLSSVWERVESPFIVLIFKCGKIRIAQQARGESYPNYENYENIPAWSRGKGEWKQLSPFYLKFSDGEIFENAWQAYKVWEKVDKQNTKNWKWPEEKHVNEDGITHQTITNVVPKNGQLFFLFFTLHLVFK